ncbi:hypothetical protein N7471_001617 [Penicillium samsonianum]|uniref:uncharacterized protein n=1 Tax=Penicillium samsonianum TaxID=1882272 RepID=UPI002546FB9B|nr:uncharacterized protein N7471_001617 [Penicillium samsonianum]KAJ6150418.1 hypothetical protein N7471_001617 [Penicillium samsonianum]
MEMKKHESRDFDHHTPDKLQCGTTISLSHLPPLLQDIATQELEALEKRLVRRLDIRLMPMLVLIYILNYLDRNAIAAAKLAGITEDLELSSVQFQTSVSILFVGYILMQVPSNLFLNKVGKPAIYLPTCMVIWVSQYRRISLLLSLELSIIQRAFYAEQAEQSKTFVVWSHVGFVEAAYFPGCMVTLSAWYTRKELSLRTAILYCGSLLAGAFSGLIAAGITDSMDGVRGLRAWRWLFIIEGTITVVVAFSAYFVLVNFPHNTPGISAQERELALWRLQKDIGAQNEGAEENPSLGEGFKQCVADWKVWFLVTLVFGATSSGTINSFFPTVVEGLGKDRIQTLLLTVPPYILACIVAMLVSLNADRSAFIIGITWVANTLPRPSSKKAAALAFANAIGNCSSIYSPYLYPSSGAPRFVLAMSVNAATSLLSIATATIFRFLLQNLNKKLEGQDVEECEEGGRRKERFRYLL